MLPAQPLAAGTAGVQVKQRRLRSLKILRIDHAHVAADVLVQVLCLNSGQRILNTLLLRRVPGLHDCSANSLD